MIDTENTSFLANFDALFGPLSVPALLVEDSNSKVVELNKAAADLFRMSREAVLNQYWAGLDGQLNQIAWKHRLEEFASKQVIAYQTDLITADDFLRPVDVEMVRVGQHHTLIMLHNRLAEVIDEADLELLSEEGKVGFWMYNRVDDILYLSPYLLRLINLPEVDNLMELARQLQPRLMPADWERIYPKFKEMISAEGDFSQLIHFEGKTGNLNLRLFAQSTGNALHITRLFGMVRHEDDIVSAEDTKVVSGDLARFSIDQSRDLIFWTRPDGTVAYVNQAVSDLLGYRQEVLIGEPAENFTEGFTHEMRVAWWEMMRVEKFQRGNWTLVGLDGRRYLVDATVNYLRFGEEEYSCGFCRDITEDAQKVRRSELSKYTIDHSRELILWTRPGGTIYFANQPFLQRTGYSWEEVETMSSRDFFLHVDETYLTDFWDQLRAENIKEGEIKLALRDGKSIPVIAKSSYLVFKGEEYNCIYLQDITKRKRRDAELLLSHEALDTAADCILWLGGRYLVRYVNQTLLDVLGQSREELYGQPYTNIFPRLERSNIEQRDNLTVALRNLKGEARQLNLNCSVISTGGRQYYMLVGRDVTEFDRRQKELMAAYEEITELKNRLQDDNIQLREEVNVKYNFNQIITVSSRYQKVLQQMGKVADVNTTVLITGETGTGKELLARSIHSLSERSDQLLVKVNCATLPENLIESELFGHEKGAFTGAVSRKKGRFEMADKGTLFLDEVGELPLELQSKLLRVLQEDEFERLGGTETIKVDVRLVAATNRDLEAMVRAGKFRADLYYRLNVFPIVNLPLRDRPEDIPVLTKHFVNKFAKRQNKIITSISSVDMKRLSGYAFPGNIRELENLVERAVVLSNSEVLSIPFDDKKQQTTSDEEAFLSLEEMQRRHIIAALRQTDGCVTGPNGAGVLLGMNDRTLVSRMRKLDIKKLDYLQ
jgi:PAS domain S-box-containing protein